MSTGTAAAGVSIDRIPVQGGPPILLIKGDFVFADDPAALSREFNATGAKIVTFNSNGGNILAAMAYGRTIRSLGLSTFQLRSAQCASACTLAFVGGVVRQAEPGSIGVHQSSFSPEAQLDGQTAVAAVQAMTAQIMTYLIDMGVDPRLLQLSLAVGANDMRYLTASEMLEYKVTSASMDSLPKVSSTETTPKPETPETATKPVVLTVEDKALAFMTKYHEAWSRSNVDALAFMETAYADNISFYGKIATKQTVLGDKRKFIADPRLRRRQDGGNIDARWMENVESLLGLPGDHRRYALTLFSHQLVTFHFIDPAWTDRWLLSALNSLERDDTDAFWAGFLWAARNPGLAIFRKMKVSLLSVARDNRFEKKGYLQVIAGLILSGWGTEPQPGEAALVSDEELRTLILECSDEFRRAILSNAQRFANDAANGPNADERWWNLSLRLLSEVWPRQFSIRTPGVSSKLCDIALASGQRFPHFVEAVLPIISVIDGDRVYLPTLRQAAPTVVEQFPTETLELLYATLPSNPKAWPYGIEDVLKMLGGSDAISGDQRLLELRRRMDRR